MPLIDQQEALDALNAQADEMSHWHEGYAEQRKGILTAVRIVSDIKPKQEIIRCKDCKHHWTHRCMDSIPREICDLNQTFYDAEVDFCSLAEKRGEE